MDYQAAWRKLKEELAILLESSSYPLSGFSVGFRAGLYAVDKMITDTEDRARETPSANPDAAIESVVKGQRPHGPVDPALAERLKKNRD